MPTKKRNARKMGGAKTKEAALKRALGGSWWSDVRHGRFKDAFKKTVDGVKKGLKQTKVLSEIAKDIPVVGAAVSEAIEKKGYGRGKRSHSERGKRLHSERKHGGSRAVKF